MTERPLVSVCIANYNGIEIIDDCLRSVRQQLGNTSFEIIVHDDASTDNSVEQIRKHYPDVLLLTSNNNVGYCVSNNRMTKVAKGQYYLLLNNDAALFPDAIETLFNYAQKNVNSGILGLPQYCWENDELLDRGCFLDPFLNNVPNFHPGVMKVGLVVGACLWIPSHLWHAAGGFPEHFEFIAEDLFLCTRTRLLGYDICVMNASGFKHQVGVSYGGSKGTQKRLSTNTTRRQHSERNKTFTIATTYPFPLLLLIMPTHIIFLTIEGIFLATLKWDWHIFFDIYWNAFSSLWHRRKLVVETRKQIQSTRCIGTLKFLSVFVWLPYKLIMLFKFGIPRISR